MIWPTQSKYSVLDSWKNEYKSIGFSKMKWSLLVEKCEPLVLSQTPSWWHGQRVIPSSRTTLGLWNELVMPISTFHLVYGCSNVHGLSSTQKENQNIEQLPCFVLAIQWPGLEKLFKNIKNNLPRICWIFPLKVSNYLSNDISFTFRSSRIK